MKLPVVQSFASSVVVLMLTVNLLVSRVNGFAMPPTRTPSQTILSSRQVLERAPSTGGGTRLCAVTTVPMADPQYDSSSWYSYYNNNQYHLHDSPAKLDEHNDVVLYQDTRRRSMVKALLWRGFSGAVSFVTTFVFTGGQSDVALEFVGYTFLPKAFVLFLGDRAINKSNIAGHLVDKGGRDTAARSLAKALAFRTFAISINVAIATIALRQSLIVAARIASSDAVVKTLTMFLYERVWQRVTWGKIAITTKTS